jgi:hypothetical protein
MKRTCRARDFFGLRHGTPERRLAIDRLAGLQRRHGKVAVRGYLDGDRDDINESSSIIAAGLEYQRSAPKTAAASRALCSLRVATAASFSPRMPWIAGTCDIFVQPPLAFAPTIPTRIL